MTSSATQDPPNPLLLKSLQNHQVVAEVTACDHYRIHGGLSVESDYIVTVRPTQQQDSKSAFESFEISKTYSAFRTFAQQLCKATEAHGLERRVYDDAFGGADRSNIPPDCYKLAKYSQLMSHLIDSQKRTRYLGKVNYMYVKVLAKERTSILNDVLQATVHYFPTRASMEQHPYIQQVALIIQTFLLTDFCLHDKTTTRETPSDRQVNQDATTNSKHYTNLLAGPLGLVKKVNLEELNPMNLIGGSSHKKNTKTADAPAATVVPLSFRQRRSMTQRATDDQELAAVGEQASLLLDDDRPHTEFLPSYAQPVPTVRASNSWGIWLDNNPFVFVAVAVVAVRVLQTAQGTQVRLDGDVALLLIFACFCLGLHTPRPMVGGFDRPMAMMGAVKIPEQQDQSGRKLLARSMKSTTRRSSSSTQGRVPVEVVTDVDAEDEGVVMGSPMAVFPKGAPIGSHNK